MDCPSPRLFLVLVLLLLLLLLLSFLLLFYLLLLLLLLLMLLLFVLLLLVAVPLQPLNGNPLGQPARASIMDAKECVDMVRIERKC